MRTKEEERTPASVECAECVELCRQLEDLRLPVIQRLNPRITYAQAREIQHKGVEYVRKLRRERDAAHNLAWERGKKLLALREERDQLAAELKDLRLEQ